MEEATQQEMTVRGVAAYLNVDNKMVCRLGKCDDLQDFEVTRLWRFRRSDLDDWIDLQKKATQKNAEEKRLSYLNISNSI